MVNKRDCIVEAGWWFNGRLAVAGEFANNHLGHFLRIKYKFTVDLNQEVIGQDDLHEVVLLDGDYSEGSEWETVSEEDEQ